MATQAPEVVGNGENPTEGTDYLADAREYGRYAKQQGIRLGLLAARSAFRRGRGKRTDLGTGSEVDENGKAPMDLFAKEAGVTPRHVSYSLTAWELGAEAGYWPHAAELKPGDDPLTEQFEGTATGFGEDETDLDDYIKTMARRWSDLMQKAHKRNGKKSQQDSTPPTETEQHEQEPEQAAESPEEIIASGAETSTRVKVLEERDPDTGETPTEVLLAIRDAFEGNLDRLNRLGISGIRETDKAIDILVDIKRYADEASETAQSDMEMLESPATQENSE